MNIGDITADIYYEIIRPKMVTSLVALSVVFALVLFVPVAITATVIRSMRLIHMHIQKSVHFDAPHHPVHTYGATCTLAAFLLTCACAFVWFCVSTRPVCHITEHKRTEYVSGQHPKAVVRRTGDASQACLYQ